MRVRALGKAQSILEYVAVIGIIAAVLIVMGVYYKRAVQGRYRQAGDVFGGGEQYQPGVTQGR
jgi:Flp pilus assembly pilin Flp